MKIPYLRHSAKGFLNYFPLAIMWTALGYSQAATTGFNQTAVGPWDYNDVANWATGTINGLWDSSLTLAGAQTVTFAADSTLTTGLTFNYVGNQPLTLRSSGLSNQTITLGGDISVNPSSNQTVTIGSGTANQNLNVDLGGVTRTFSVVGASKGLTFTNVISNGGIIKSGAGTLTLSSANTYTGGTTISAGTVIAGNASAFGSSGTITLGDANSATNAITLSYGSNTISRPITVANQGGTITLGRGNFTGAITLNKSVTLGYTGGAGGFKGGISGTGDVTIQANGGYTVIFIDAANTFNGNVYVQTGAELDLQNGGGQNLSFIPDASNVDLAGTGILYNVNNGINETINALTGSGTLKGYNNTWTIGSAGGSGTFSGSVQNGAGPTGIIKTGAGTQTFSGTNSYTGKTTVSNGTLQFAKQASLYNNTSASWTAANINVKSAATLALNVDSAGTAGFTSASLNTLLGNISVANTATEGLQSGAILGFDTTTATGGTFTQGNAIANSTGASGGAIGLTKLGTGTLVLDKTNTYTGGTTLGAGTLTLANVAALGSAGQAVTLNGGKLDLHVDSSVNAYNVTLGGNVTIEGDRATSGNGIVNTFGTLSIGTNTLSITTNTADNVASGTDYGVTFGATSLTGNATFDVANNAAGVGTLTLGTIGETGGARSLTKQGAGTLLLSGATTYSGGTNITAGTLTLGNSNTLADTSTVTVSGTGILNIAALTDTVGTFNMSAGSLNGSGTLTATTYGLSGGTVTANLGAGTMNVTGSTALNGTAGATTVGISAGTLTLGSNDRLANTATVTVSGTGILNIAALTDTVGTFNMSAGSLNGTGTLTATTYGLTGGTVNALLGAGAVTVNTGTVTLGSAGRLNSSSSLLIQGGQLTLAGAESVLSYQQTGGTLAGAYTLTSAAAYDMRAGTVSANLGGSVGLNKSTVGTVTLNGTNTYTGLTAISGAGTLALGASGSIDNSSGVALGTVGTLDVSAKSGYTVARLTGSGTVIGSLTVSTELAIGNSPGSVTYNGDLTLGALSKSTFEVTGGAITGDLGDVDGLLTIATGATLDLVQLGGYTANDKFTLFAYNTLSGTFAGLADDTNLTDNLGGIWKINYNDNTAGLNGGVGSLYVTVTAVPEPGAALIGGLGLLALLRRRRVR